MPRPLSSSFLFFSALKSCSSCLINSLLSPTTGKQVNRKALKRRLCCSCDNLLQAVLQHHPDDSVLHFYISNVWTQQGKAGEGRKHGEENGESRGDEERKQWESRIGEGGETRRGEETSRLNCRRGNKERTRGNKERRAGKWGEKKRLSTGENSAKESRRR